MNTYNINNLNHNGFAFTIAFFWKLIKFQLNAIKISLNKMQTLIVRLIVASIFAVIIIILITGITILATYKPSTTVRDVRIADK